MSHLVLLDVCEHARKSERGQQSFVVDVARISSRQCERRGYAHRILSGSRPAEYCGNCCVMVRTRWIAVPSPPAEGATIGLRARLARSMLHCCHTRLSRL